MINSLINNIKTSGNKVVLFGASSVLTHFFEKILTLGIKISHICDNDINKIGKEMFGFVIEDPNILFKNKSNFNVIITSSFFKEIETQLSEYSNVITCIDYKKLYDLVSITAFVPKESLLENIEELREDYNSFVRNLQLNINPIAVSRYNFSKPYIKGKGLEIGAFHLPTQVCEGTKVEYVDQMSMIQIKERFPKFINTYCVYPSIIDNGEKLLKIQDESYDFLIANHMIEHTENVFKTIQNHLRVLKKGGILYYAVPDKRFTFDKNRELTTYEHLKAEYLYGSENYRYEHFLDFVTNVQNVKEEKEASKVAKKLSEEGLDTHFHVWTSETFIDHIKKAIDDKILNIEILEHTHKNDIESITILKKL